MRSLIITVVFVFAVVPLLSQQGSIPSYEETLALYEDLFSAEEPLHLTLKFDVKALQKTRYEDEYHEAEMTLAGNDDTEVSHSIQVKPKESIRQKICYLPTLWLKIGNSGTSADSPQDGILMNLVMRCKDAAQFEPYVLREYLAYRLYNTITPHSYRVRVVKLNIIDTGRDNKATEDWAFLLEPDDLMARRLNSKMIDNNRLSIHTVNPEVMNRLSMFQYMIGNSDYSVTGRHNLSILTSNEYGPTGFIPVPYEFDYSGLVNTEYAIPGETLHSLGITSVRDRYYLGPCREEKVHNATIQELAKSEAEIMKLIKDFKYLDDKEKDDMIGYLDSYFKASKESGFIDQKITPTCR